MFVCLCPPARPSVLSRAVSELTWRSGQPSFSCHLPFSTHLSFLLGQFGQELFTDLDFTLCSASGSLEVSGFQLRKEESACILVTLIQFFL